MSRLGRNEISLLAPAAAPTACLNVNKIFQQVKLSTSKYRQRSRRSKGFYSFVSQLLWFDYSNAFDGEQSGLDRSSKERLAGRV